MPASSRRNKFAPPFVITLSALPACAGAEQPKPVIAEVPPPATGASSIAEESPPQNPPKDGDNTWTLSTDGTNCFTSIGAPCAKDDPRCKAGPKQSYPCPKGLTTQDLSSFREIKRYPGATNCMLMYTGSMECDPGDSCNPPRPRDVPCPDQ